MTDRGNRICAVGPKEASRVLVGRRCAFLGGSFAGHQLSPGLCYTIAPLVMPLDDKGTLVLDSGMKLKLTWYKVSNSRREVWFGKASRHDRTASTAWWFCRQLIILLSRGHRSLASLTCNGANSDNLSISASPSECSLVITIPDLCSPPCTLLISQTLFGLVRYWPKEGHLHPMRDILDLILLHTGFTQLLQKERHERVIYAISAGLLSRLGGGQLTIYRISIISLLL